MRIAAGITPGVADAEEAVQDAFVKAYGALHRLRAGAPLAPWLLMIVANEARNRRRSAGRREHVARRAASEGHREAGSPATPCCGRRATSCCASRARRRSAPRSR